MLRVGQYRQLAFTMRDWLLRLFMLTTACQAIFQASGHNRYNQPNAKKQRRSGWQPKLPPSIFGLSAKPASEESQWRAGRVPDDDDDERQIAAVNKSNPALLDKDRKRPPLRRPQKSPLDIPRQASRASAAPVPAPSSDSDVLRPESTRDSGRRATHNRPLLRVERSLWWRAPMLLHNRRCII